MSLAKYTEELATLYSVLFILLIVKIIDIDTKKITESLSDINCISPFIIKISNITNLKNRIKIKMLLFLFKKLFDIVLLVALYVFCKIQYKKYMSFKGIGREKKQNYIIIYSILILIPFSLGFILNIVYSLENFTALKNFIMINIFVPVIFYCKNSKLNRDLKGGNIKICMFFSAIFLLANVLFYIIASSNVLLAYKSSNKISNIKNYFSSNELKNLDITDFKDIELYESTSNFSIKTPFKRLTKIYFNKNLTKNEILPFVAIEIFHYLNYTYLKLLALYLFKYVSLSLFILTVLYGYEFEYGLYYGLITIISFNLGFDPMIYFFEYFSKNESLEYLKEFNLIDMFVCNLIEKCKLNELLVGLEENLVNDGSVFNNSIINYLFINTVFHFGSNITLKRVLDLIYN